MADPLVVGVDASPESFDALDAAVRLARQSQAPLFVVHVEHAPALTAVGEPEAGAEIAEALEETKEKARTETSARLVDSGIDWSFEVTQGDPTAALIRSAGAHHARAIIVGGKGHGVVGGLLLGSVAQGLVRHSPISVLVVRDGEAHNVAAPADGAAEDHATA